MIFRTHLCEHTFSIPLVSSFRADARAEPALPTTGFCQEAMLSEAMAALAVRFGVIACLTPTNILGWRDSLKVFGVNARANPAQVIDMQA
jgi:hypothetical protein